MAPKTATKKKAKRKSRKKAAPKVDQWGIPSSMLDTVLMIPNYDPRRDADGYYFDPIEAQKAADFFPEILTHYQGKMAKKPFVLEPWQTAIIYNINGWRVAEGPRKGMRRYRRVLLYVPKKNGKTPIAAGISLLVLTTDHEGGARIIGAASAKKQAGYIFENAAHMVRNSKILKKHLQVFGFRGGSVERCIAYDAEGSKYYVIASDVKTFDGDNISAAFIDELHRYDDSQFIDVVEASDASRDNSLIMYTTTADYNRKDSPCNRKLRKARNVRDGLDRDPEFLPIIYEPSEDEAERWTEEEVWRKVNPNFGVSVNIDSFRKDFKKAVDEPSYRNDFKRLRLNIVTDAATVWIPVEKWDDCGPGIELPTAEIRDDLFKSLHRRECIAGLDLSSKRDLTTLTLLFPETIYDGNKEKRTYTSLHWYWCPHDNAVEREQKDKVPYLAWREAGWIEFTEGNIVDYSWIRHTIKDLARFVTIREIACDPYAATQLMNQLGNEDGFVCYEVHQGWKSLSEPCKEFEASIIAGNWRHDGSPVMNWNIRNCVAWRDKAGNITPDKKVSTERIDGVSATVTALARAMAGEGTSGSVYDEPGRNISFA